MSMRCLGLISPYGWQCAGYYYRALNQEVHNRSGGLRSARLVLSSLDFQEIDHLVNEEQWFSLAERLKQTAGELIAAGAEGILLCSLSMHRFADDIAASIPVPLLHIADAVEHEIHPDTRHKPLGLIGPRLAIAPGPVVDRFAGKRPRDVVVPSDADARRLDEILFLQVCQGFARESARAELLRIIADMRKRRAGTFVFGCPELGELLGPEDYRPNFYNAPEIHVVAAVDWMLAPQRKPARV